LFAISFPKLVDPLLKKTSEATQQYNCIAWAFEDNTKKWWPSKRAYWPEKFDGMNAMEAFSFLFAKNGWVKTDNRLAAAGLKKIALYYNPLTGEPTHAARLLENGFWTSKLGDHIDLSHELSELEGPEYGLVLAIFEKAV
jgi:hypothetical protein